MIVKFYGENCQNCGTNYWSGKIKGKKLCDKCIDDYFSCKNCTTGPEDKSKCEFVNEKYTDEVTGEVVDFCEYFNDEEVDLK